MRRTAQPASGHCAAQPQQACHPPIPTRTLAAMQDELDRARTRLELKIPGTRRTRAAILYPVPDSRSGRPHDRRGIRRAGFLDHRPNRIMSVDVRVGNYNLDSSNFITDEGFSGFLGSTGTVGIDRDYDSLRQDLWLATDQAFKAAVENFSKKQAFMSRLAKAPSIPDFSKAPPTVNVEPLRASGLDHAQLGAGGSRRFRGAARVSAVAKFARHVSPDLHDELPAQYEGTKIRANRSLAAIEASLETESDDGMALHNFWPSIATVPINCPLPTPCGKTSNMPESS
jgi:hypothetical protein